ncbi:hypothetical protein [Saccharothrix algeriensis]|uniref:Uncharacterized protein n=1 Tax=Saccharothrix algeriensis TaxID=173560 RepID=A0ABS2S116_9PSEU|nr:hypothetical protein [Saccharothrix algeriensis]MBM7809610.1 hypothetical protein [Saccharothrix algeriensis]
MTVGTDVLDARRGGAAAGVAARPGGHRPGPPRRPFACSAHRGG